MSEDVVNEIIYRHYFESGDFNGIPVYKLQKALGLSLPELKELTRELIANENADCVFGNVHPNAHIKAYSEITISQQLEWLDQLEFSEHFCLYPSKKFLSERVDKTSYTDRPYECQLALGAGQLDYRVFDISVLEYYRNDPRYYYQTDFINGQISIHDEFYESESMPEHDQILLQSFGFAFDDDFNRAVAVFIRYLSDLSPEHQKIWKAKEISGAYKLHPDYYRNSLLGDWGTRISLFDAFLQEIKVINEMAEIMGKKQLFKSDYYEQKPDEFGFLLRPTLREFNNFVLLLDKMMSDNINKEFFAGDIDLEKDEVRSDGKIVVTQRGTIALLDDWVKRFFRPVDPEPIEDMLSSFRKVRKLRQKPAHKIDENVFDQKYFKDQRQIMLDAYDAIRTIRLILANHPRVKASPPQIGKHLKEGKIWDI
ncbi:MAG: AAA family ATPase [Pseudomonadales bacterium]|nr:AAA family ATPase [Pseudomonadales bacterium]